MKHVIGSHALRAIMFSSFIATIFIAILLIAFQQSTLSAPLVTRTASNSQAAAEYAPAQLLNSLDGITVTKTVNRAFAHSGDRLQYTVRIINSSAATRTLQLTDTMGNGITPVVPSLPGTVLLPPLQPNTPIWWDEYIIGPGGAIAQRYEVDVTRGVTNGDALVNTVMIEEKGGTVRKFDTVTVTVRFTDDVWLPQVALNPILPDVQNSGFEAGPGIYWRETTKAAAGRLLFAADTLPEPIVPHSGLYVAWLGGTANEVSILESQAIAIPHTFDTFTLRYREWIASAEETCGRDHATVRVRNMDTGTVSSLTEFDLCRGRNTGQWEARCIAVTGLASQRLTFAFVAELNDDQNSNWFLDEIALSAESCPAP